MKTLAIILALVVVVFFVFIGGGNGDGGGEQVRGSCPPGYYSRPGSTWAGWTFDCLPIGTDAMEPGLPMDSTTRFGTMYVPIVAGTRLIGVGSKPERASIREFPVQKDLTLFPGC
jgi:hypothetical protein